MDNKVTIIYRFNFKNDVDNKNQNDFFHLLCLSLRKEGKVAIVLIDNNSTYATIEPSPPIKDNDDSNTDNKDGKFFKEKVGFESCTYNSNDVFFLIKQN